MNDDQIQSELERRAGSGAPQPDWAKRVLLPAVWREVDARPQPVVTSRWSSGIGVAALVTALVVLVVAVPRLAPQPPSATSTLANPLVLTTADFAANLAAGELDGQTVLVDGGIVAYDGPPIFGGFCGPNGPACLLGQLEGVTPRVLVFGPDIAFPSSGDSTVEVSPGWPWWTRVAPPISGTLALSVDGPGGVAYVGRVVLNGDQLTWPVTDAAALDINSLERDQVVLVDGWLGGVSAGTLRCRAPLGPREADLPSRHCSGEWIASDSAPAFETRLDVQPGAYDTFAPTPSDSPYEPRHAIYAIAPRLEGWCGGDPTPCWLWNVAARIESPPGSQATPTVPPTSSPTSPAEATIECTGDGVRPVTVTDETGLVTGCRLISVELGSSLPPGPTATNPDGDLTRLRLTWGTSSCVNSVTARFSGDATSEGRFSMVLTGNLIEFGCEGVLVFSGFELQLRSDMDATAVSPASVLDEVTPTPTPSPPEAGPRTLDCVSPEPLGDPGITLIDHSGRIESCSMAYAEVIPDAPIEVSTTQVPGQLGVDWTVNTGCRGDEEMEFWGPLEQPIGLVDYVLRVAHRTLPGETCNDLGAVRRVQLSLTDPVQPSDIRALVNNESAAEHTTSSQSGATTEAGSFDLLLAAPQVITPNEPIDITASLTYNGPGSVALSGRWQPNFSFVSLTGGPSLRTYGSLLLCPDAERQLSPGDSIAGQLDHPQTRLENDPNNAYYDQFAYDGQFRLPAGDYLVFTGVGFNVGSSCRGDPVALRTAIVIRVGPAPAGEPMPWPPAQAIDCSETVSILIDRTGLVEACSAWTPEPGQSGVSQGPDASSVLVAWTYSYCRGAPFVRFEQAGDRYVFELGHLATLPTVWPSCEPVTRTVGIAVRFTQPLDAGLIDAVSEH